MSHPSPLQAKRTEAPQPPRKLGDTRIQKMIQAFAAPPLLMSRRRVFAPCYVSMLDLIRERGEVRVASPSPSLFCGVWVCEYARRSTRTRTRTNTNPYDTKLELKLELIQPHTTQKPVLRGEVDARALRV